MVQVGFFTVDEDMDLDAIKVVLEKNGEQVSIWMAANPRAGRYELHREDGAEDGGEP